MMEPPIPETSPPPSARGLKGVLAKARRNLKDNSSTTSVNGPDGSGGLRSSIDSTAEKLRARSGGDNGRDDGENPGSAGLSALIPGRIKKRRKRRQEEAARERDEWEKPRGRSMGDADMMATNGLDRSSDIFDDDDDDGDSSMLTYESETESPLHSPPPLISHQSHIGYLTSSSPLIKASSIDGTPSSQNLDGTLSSTQPVLKSSTFPASYSATSTDLNLAPNHAAISNPIQNASSLSLESPGSSRSRGVSPGSRLKEAFTPASRKKDGKSNTSPDRKLFQSVNGATTFGGVFGNGDKRNSISLRRASKAAENPPSVPQDIKVQDAQAKISGRVPPSVVTSPRTPPDSSLEAPSTLVTPPTPTDQQPENSDLAVKKTISNGTNSNTITSASGNMISHRRVRSDPATHPPSKLSNSMTAPLSPTIEEKTPGSRTPSGNLPFGGNGGFFSSVFVAAQNAANTLSNTIANNPPRSRSGTQTTEDGNSQEQEVSAPLTEPNQSIPVTQPKQRAVDTIGTGDLNLSHLGISVEQPVTANAFTSSFPTTEDSVRNVSTTLHDEAAARAEDASAAQAISAAYSEKVVDPGSGTPIVEDSTPSKKPRSIAEQSITGDQTPPAGSIFEGDSGIRRSGSVRSRVGAISRRNRNNSSATGTTIGAAISASHAALSSPLANGSVPKLTGFAVASKKRNRDFHQLFRSVPEDDYLIEDYSCALQRDIILAGRIYVSEGHICFSSNILGWVTTLIISFDEVVSIEKENTAMVFPNAIAIQTLHARQTFRSLLSREATYDLLVGIWKISHPSLKHLENGMRLAEGDSGDRNEKTGASASEDESGTSEDEEDVYDEDEDDDGQQGSVTEAGDAGINGEEDAELPNQAVTRKSSALGVIAGNAAGAVPTQPESKASERAGAIAVVAGADFPGPASHAPTECSDGSSHYDKVLKDEIVPAPLGKVFSMIFGAASGGFMTKWLLDDIKVFDLELEDDQKGLSDEVRTRTYSYIKPLGGSIGPKQTKCIVTEVVDAIDFEKAVSVTISTQTPDVPSGNVFSTKTKYCLTWASGNATRIFMNCTVEWTGKSWIKGPIEKGANEGQQSYANDLIKALKAGLTSRPRAGTVGSKGKAKGRRKKGDAEASKKSTTTSTTEASNAKAKSADWGLLEPLHGVFSPIIDIISPLISSNAVIGILVFLLVFNWFRGPRVSPGGDIGYPGLSSPQRMAAYEQLWRQEENDLWNWLESRVGMAPGYAYPASPEHENHAASKRSREERQHVLRGKEMEAKVDGEGMSEREVREALRVTEEKLRILKEVVGRKGSGKDERKQRDSGARNEETET